MAKTWGCKDVQMQKSSATKVNVPLYFSRLRHKSLLITPKIGATLFIEILKQSVTTDCFLQFYWVFIRISMDSSYEFDKTTGQKAFKRLKSVNEGIFFTHISGKN